MVLTYRRCENENVNLKKYVRLIKRTITGSAVDQHKETVMVIENIKRNSNLRLQIEH